MQQLPSLPGMPGAETDPAKAAAPGPDLLQWSAGINYGWFGAELIFDEGIVEADIMQHVLVASLGVAFDFGLRLGVGLGASIDGTIEPDRYDDAPPDKKLRLMPGFVGSVSLSYRFLDAEGWSPFIDTAFTLAVSHTRLKAVDGSTSPWTALDLRLGASVGWILWEIWAPYIAIRVFGGPVFWRDGDKDRVGTDRHHFQGAVGSVVTFDFGLSVYFEYAPPIGEQGMSGGLSMSF